MHSTWDSPSLSPKISLISTLYIIAFHISQVYCTTPQKSFTFVALPDTQYYVAYFQYNLYRQFDWLIQCEDALNIRFVTHLGDVVEHGNTFPVEWFIADSVFSRLRFWNIPHGIALGNHDMKTPGHYDLYDETFPPSVYSSFPWYGGSSDNVTTRNTFQLVMSESGTLVMFMHLGYLTFETPEALTWINSTLLRYPEAYVILVSHIVGSTCGGVVSQDVREIAQAHCNVRLILGGHSFACGGGERAASYVNSCGQVRWALISDYQGRLNGGSAWLRIYNVAANLSSVCAYTFTPLNNTFETDSNSYFSITEGVNSTGDGCPPLNSCILRFIPPSYVIMMSLIHGITFISLLFALKGDK